MSIKVLEAKIKALKSENKRLKELQTKADRYDELVEVCVGLMGMANIGKVELAKLTPHK